MLALSTVRALHSRVVLFVPRMLVAPADVMPEDGALYVRMHSSQRGWVATSRAKQNTTSCLMGCIRLNAMLVGEQRSTCNCYAFKLRERDSASLCQRDDALMCAGSLHISINCIIRIRAWHEDDCEIVPRCVPLAATES